MNKNVIRKAISIILALTVLMAGTTSIFAGSRELDPSYYDNYNVLYEYTMSQPLISTGNTLNLKADGDNLILTETNMLGKGWSEIEISSSYRFIPEIEDLDNDIYEKSINIASPTPTIVISGNTRTITYDFSDIESEWRIKVKVLERYRDANLGDIIELFGYYRNSDHTSQLDSMKKNTIIDILKDIDPATHALTPYAGYYYDDEAEKAKHEADTQYVRDKTAELTRGITNPLTKAGIIINWVSNNAAGGRYILRAADPHYLFEGIGGNCEAYANATILMLRTAGIPSMVIDTDLYDGTGHRQCLFYANGGWHYFDNMAGSISLNQSVEVFEQNHEDAIYHVIKPEMAYFPLATNLAPYDVYRAIVDHENKYYEITMKPGDSHKTALWYGVQNRLPNTVYTFESSNSAAVSVDSDGNIKALAIGESVITIKYNGTRIITETIYVSNFENPLQIQIPGHYEYFFGYEYGFMELSWPEPPKSTGEKENYRFDGWYLTNNNTVLGDVNSIEDVMRLLEDFKDGYVVAGISERWTKIKTDVLFNLNYTYSGDISLENLNSINKKILFGDVIGELPTPIREDDTYRGIGYRFDGWYTEIIGGVKITEDTIVEKDCNYYPHWSEYVLENNTNNNEDSSNKDSNNEDSYNCNDELVTDTFNDYSGYDYRGINYNDNDNYTNAETYDDTDYDSNTNPTIEVKAPTASVKYKVTMNANGGKVSKKSITKEKNKKIGKLPKPTKKGYTFKGWYTKKVGGSKISATKKIVKNVTYYAHWKKK